MSASSRNAALFLRAKTEEELMLLFLQYQLKTSKQYEVINVYPSKDGVVIWFRAYIDNKEMLDVSGKGYTRS
jgi:hypothetical protein